MQKSPEVVETSGLFALISFLVQLDGKSTVRGYNAPCFDSVVHIFGSRFDALGQWGQKGQNINTAERIIRLLPSEKANGQSCAKKHNNDYHSHRDQDISCADTQKGMLHQGDSLGQWEQADDLLHGLGHNLHGQCRAGEHQHGEIQQRRNDPGLLGVFCYAAHQHPNTEGGQHGEQPAADKRQDATVDPDFP